MNSIPEFERGVLLVDLPQDGLLAGDVGVIVHVHPGGSAYEVEFFTLDGRTLAVSTVEANQIRSITSRDIMHAREIPEDEPSYQH